MSQFEVEVNHFVNYVCKIEELSFLLASLTRTMHFVMKEVVFGISYQAELLLRNH